MGIAQQLLSQLNTSNLASILNPGGNPLSKLSNCCCGGGSENQSNDNQSNQSNENKTDFHSNIFQQGKFTPKATKFGNFKWEKLPNKIQMAALTLGINKDAWNGEEWNNSEDKWWEDLTTDERNAAVTLGWDESAWDSMYENKDWTDLPSHVITAASSLGFTQQTWDDGEWPAVGDKYWAQMTNDEKSALYVLGYYAYKWE